MLVAFDYFLCASLLVTAWWAMASRDLLKATLYFIVFGLLMALVWGRLNAIDIALAEAAIGAGITGALLITAVSNLAGVERAGDNPETPTSGASGWWRKFWLGLSSIALGGTLVWVIVRLPPAPQRLRTEILDRLDVIGIKNSVTAALLDFRGYDTLLEVAVLMLAVIVLWSVAGSAKMARVEPPEPSLSGMTRLLLPISILVAGYLLWRGADHPGGAFQAGAVLAGAGVLMTFTWPARVRTAMSGKVVRLNTALAPLGFLAVGIGTAIENGIFLEYPPGWAPFLMLLIETGVMVSVATILLLLVLGCRSVIIRNGTTERPTTHEDAS